MRLKDGRECYDVTFDDNGVKTRVLEKPLATNEDNLVVRDYNIIVHIIPTFDCNLHCKHCYNQYLVDTYDEKNFFYSLDNFEIITNTIRENINYCLFGGECFLNKDIAKRVIDTGKVDVIQSNLLLLDEEILDILIEKKIAIGTSWNPGRFVGDQYKQWLKKLEMVSKKNKDLAIFITLTEDLLKSNVYEVLDTLNNYNVTQLTLTEYIPSTKQLIKKVDNWICKLLDDWRWKFKLTNEEKYKNGNKNGCKHTMYSILPSGRIIPECTFKIRKVELKECEDCKWQKDGICYPCPKQQQCSFLEKFYLKVKDKNYTY